MLYKSIQEEMKVPVDLLWSKRSIGLGLDVRFFCT